MSARAFSEAEYQTLCGYFRSRRRERDRLLLVLGCGTGLRVSELLSLRVGDVWREGGPLPELVIGRSRLKGGRGRHCRRVRNRRIVLTAPVREALGGFLAGQRPAAEAFLFGGGRGSDRPLNRSQVFRILRAAVRDCGLPEVRISTHCFRKTFVRRVYAASGHDLIATQRIIGHANPMTTAAYLETTEAAMDAVVLQAIPA